MLNIHISLRGLLYNDDLRPQLSPWQQVGVVLIRAHKYYLQADYQSPVMILVYRATESMKYQSLLSVIILLTVHKDEVWAAAKRLQLWLYNVSLLEVV